MLGDLSGTERLFLNLLYGTGLRLMEGLRLRVKDLDFGQNQIIVRDGKGGKDRVTMSVDEWVRHPDGAGAVGPQELEDDDDLHARLESGRDGSP